MAKQGKRLHPFEHAYRRPDTYIGSVVTTTRREWVYDDEDTIKDAPVEGVVVEDIEGDDTVEVEDPKKSGGKFVLRDISYNKGLTRVFIEPLSNAIDNKWRSEKHEIAMKSIDFDIDRDPDSETYGYITITNDGYWIPVEHFEYDYEDFRTGKKIKETLYPAQVFFGEMLAGTNFEDDGERKTSGRNGMGAKATIIFSKHAVVEHTDPNAQKKFHQEYFDNGKRRTEPKITVYKAKGAYTSISFLPDYEYFKYPNLDSDFFSLMKRYVYESAMITGLAVTLNGEKIQVKNLGTFAKLFYPNQTENKMISFKAPNGDECVILDKGFPEADLTENVSHMSWVNGINTKDGGVHVEVWRDLLVSSLVKAFNARQKKGKKKEENIKTSAKDMYPYLLFFVRCETTDAKFDSQTKDRLESPEIDLAPEKADKIELTKSVTEATKKMLKWNFIALLEEKLLARAERAQQKKDGVKKKVQGGKNLTDANFAGGKRSNECTLFITEGLSAKTFADQYIAGIENGTDYYGSFAIRGKFINAQRFSPRKVNANNEVKDLKKALGLTYGETYTDISDLRYGRVMILADQDDDGFHIRGLLINFFLWYWPSLLQLKGEDGSPYEILQSLSTAVVRIEAKGKSPERLFYSNPEYHKWYVDHGQYLKGLGELRYLKGLGSHRSGDEVVYLNDPKVLVYGLDGEEKEFVNLGFGKEESNLRKEWITKDMVKPGEIKLGAENEVEPMIVSGPISISVFINTQLIIYHKMALRRALPSMYDSFKEGQRKAFYGICLDADPNKASINLENLVGSVKKATGYHHGATSLEGTIKNMAQGFVDTNNIPLLVNDGQFGSRYYGGEDASAARYISTKPEKICSTLFHPDDLPILVHAVEDNKPVEYEVYMPVMPIILINGCHGIASGYYTEIPCYHPLKLKEWILEWLSNNGEVNLPPLVPWYREFTGEIELLQSKGKGTYDLWDPTSDTPACSWRSKGILEPSTKGWWTIKELPIGMWTCAMKEHLDSLQTPSTGKKKKDKCLLDVHWKGTPNTVLWNIKPTKDFIPDMNVIGNFKNMQKVRSLKNFHVLDENGYPRHYDRPEDLLRDFCIKRLEYYEMRKQYWLATWGKDFAKESDKYKFIKAVVDGTLLMNRPIPEVEVDMVAMGLRKVSIGDSDDGSFNYLFSMHMSSMTTNKMNEIRAQILKIKEKILELRRKSPTDLWVTDLEAFEAAYALFLKTRKEGVAGKKVKSI